MDWDNFAKDNNLGDLFLKIKSNTFLAGEIEKTEGQAVVYLPDESDISYIQFSSGSTGDPKGIILTHKNLLTNIEAINIGYMAISDE